MKNVKIGNKIIISSLILFFFLSSIKAQKSRCLFLLTESEFLNFNGLKSGVGENKYIKFFFNIKKYYIGIQISKVNSMM